MTLQKTARCFLYRHVRPVRTRHHGAITESAMRYSFITERVPGKVPLFRRSGPAAPQGAPAAAAVLPGVLLRAGPLPIVRRRWAGRGKALRGAFRLPLQGRWVSASEPGRVTPRADSHARAPHPSAPSGHLPSQGRQNEKRGTSPCRGGTMKREAQPSQGRQNTSPAHIRKRCRAFRERLEKRRRALRARARRDRISEAEPDGTAPRKEGGAWK